MPVLVKMPKWGLTMKIGTVTEWLRPEGAEVALGEPLLTVETDKAVNDVEAPAAGVLRKIVAAVGVQVPVSDPVAVIAAAGETLSEEEVDAFLAETRQEQASASSQRVRAERVAREARTATRLAEGRINASPAARKLAQQLGVDLSRVPATGPGGRITSDDVERAAAAQGEVREGYLTLPDGRRLFAVQAGRGSPPLVFLHGLGGSQTTWQVVLPDLVAQHRVVALDLPGHGLSDKPSPEETDYSLNGLAQAITEALDALDLPPVVLIGHSLGGAVAMQVALQHPERISRLVLVDSAGLGDEINSELLDRMEAEPSREEARRLLALFFHDERHILASGVEETYRQRVAPGAQEALRAVTAANFSRDGQHIGTQGRLADLNLPILIVWGAQDRVIPAQHAWMAQEVAPDARVEVFEHVGHVPQLEDAGEFVAAIERFLTTEMP